MDTRTRYVHSFMPRIHVMCMCACVSLAFFIVPYIPLSDTLSLRRYSHGVWRMDEPTFIVHPFRASQGAIVTRGKFFGVASHSYTDRASKKEELFYVRTVVDARMAVWTKTTLSK